MIMMIWPGSSSAASLAGMRAMASGPACPDQGRDFGAVAGDLLALDWDQAADR
jgi:hypothetical protein